jgi:hypothetical protein
VSHKKRAVALDVASQARGPGTALSKERSVRLGSGSKSKEVVRFDDRQSPSWLTTIVARIVERQPVRPLRSTKPAQSLTFAGSKIESMMATEFAVNRRGWARGRG